MRIPYSKIIEVAWPLVNGFFFGGGGGVARQLEANEPSTSILDKKKYVSVTKICASKVFYIRVFSHGLARGFTRTSERSHRLPGHKQQKIGLSTQELTSNFKLNISPTKHTEE